MRVRKLEMSKRIIYLPEYLSGEYFPVTEIVRFYIETDNRRKDCGKLIKETTWLHSRQFFTRREIE